jgi:hypothetical protein
MLLQHLVSHQKEMSVLVLLLLLRLLRALLLMFSRTFERKREERKDAAEAGRRLSWHAP